MDRWLLTFFLGAILSLFLPEVPALFQLFLLFFLAIGFLIHKRARAISGLWFGALWILLQAHLYHNQVPDVVIDLMQAKQRFSIEGEVLSLVVTPVKLEPIRLEQKKAEQKKAEQKNIEPRKNEFKKTLESTAELKLETTTRLNFLVNKVNNKPINKPFIVRLSWKKPDFNILQGHLLSLNVKLKPAHGLANIGTFNYLSWLKSKNIVATGYIVSNKKYKEKANTLTNNKRIKAQSSVRQQLFDQYQQLTLSAVEQPSSLYKLTPILYALTFGERSSLDKLHWKTLRATGTSHLIAISGLHVGLLAGSVFFIIMMLFQYLPLKNTHWQRVNIRYLAIAFSLLFAALYTYLAGFSLPTQRALLMLNLYWFSRLMAIKLSLKRLVLIALFILLIISPFSLLTPSFWLSFYAVSIIFVTLWRFKSWLRKGSTVYMFFKGLLVIQLALTLMLMPITALFFHEISLVSLAANIVAVPWMSMVSIPLALLSLLVMPISELLAQWCLIASLNSLLWLWHYLELLANQKNAIMALSLLQQLLVSSLGIIAFTSCYISPIRVFITFKKTIVGLTLVVLALLVSISFISKDWPFMLSDKGFLLANAANFPEIHGKPLQQGSAQEDQERAQGEQEYTSWQAVFFDVGQGLSVLIKRNEQAILYDTGDAYPSGFNMSEAVILPYLKYSGINKLEKVILSHSDNDHAGGIRQLLEGIVIGEVLSNDTRFIRLIDSVSASSKLALHQLSAVTNHNHKSRFKSCKSNDGFSWQGLTFDVLWPLSTEVLSEKVKQKNDDSCVILITDDKGHKLLLAGDISVKVEKQLIELYPQLTINALQVPHHGSKTSSSEAFLKQLSPSIAVVSAGYYNRWNMPVAFIEKRYKKLGIEFLNNAEVGQVVITFDDTGVNTQNYAEHLRPFWFSH